MLLHQPTEAEVRAFLAAQSKLSFSYPEVGATRESFNPPAGYPINHYRGKLGTGAEDYEKALAALRSWRMYSLSWTKLYWPETEIKEGAVVAVLAKHLGLWWLNACRIIYTFTEDDESHRSGFAFGTLPGHVETGEERFTVELDDKSDEVFYELFAFAKPKLLIAKIAYPLIHSVQRRFAQDSFVAMKRAVNQKD
ncbi:MAG TPA: DUF1990 domain-containing protein [Pyrinomonadaceae bacterium]